MNGKPMLFSKKSTDTNRTWYWLWMYMGFHYNDISIGEFKSPSMKKLLDASIANARICEEQIFCQKRANFLPSKDYAWVKKDQYQLDWLYSKLFQLIALPMHLLVQRVDYEYIIALFDLVGSESVLSFDDDYIYNRISSKKTVVDRLKKEWKKVEYSQKILNWFNEPKEPERIKAGWQIFCNQFPEYADAFDEFESFTDIKEVFDKIYSEPSRKELFVKEASKRHSQNKSRANNLDKKQVNLVLKKTTIDLLNDISEKYKLSRTRVIEILLLKENENNIYIPEKMRQEKGR